jgi:hypothetical protein
MESENKGTAPSYGAVPHDGIAISASSQPEDPPSTFVEDMVMPGDGEGLRSCFGKVTAPVCILNVVAPGLTGAWT